MLDIYASLLPLNRTTLLCSSDSHRTSGSSVGSKDAPPRDYLGQERGSQDEQQQSQGGQLQGASACTARPRRHRIEHVQHIAGPSTAQRMAEVGVVATPNPLHLLADAAILEARLGRERAGAGRSYAFSTLMQVTAGVMEGLSWCACVCVFCFVCLLHGDNPAARRLKYKARWVDAGAVRRKTGQCSCSRAPQPPNKRGQAGA